MRYVFLIIILLVFAGCGNDFDRSKPYVVGLASSTTSSAQQPKYYGNKPEIDHKSVIESAKIRAANEKEIALINTQRDITLEKLKQDANLQKADINKEIEFKKSDTEIVVMEQSVSVQKTYMMMIALGMFFAIVFVFYFLHKRRKDRLKMHEDMLHKEMYIKDREIQAKMAERILDTLEKGKLSPEQESKLVETFTKNTIIMPVNHIEHQKQNKEIVSE